MVQPAPTSPVEFASAASARVEAFDPASHSGDGPANRALRELSLALAAGNAEIGPRWSPGQTLRFIVLSCGGFWLAAAALYATIR